MLDVRYWILASSVTVVVSQCLNRIGYHMRCSALPRSSSPSLLACAEECLTKDTCIYMQWDTTKQECLIGTRELTFDTFGVGACLTFATKKCLAFDHNCIEPFYEYHFKGGSPILNVTEDTCRMICSLWSVCKAFRWLKEGKWNNCYLFKRLPKRGDNVHPRDTVQGMKNTTCQIGQRCVSFRVGANVLDGHSALVNKNLTRCCDQTMSDQVELAEWNPGDTTCWTHTTFDRKPYTYGPQTTIQFNSNQYCRKTDRESCLKTKKGYRMLGKIRRLRLSHDECVYICKRTVNCLAVDWEEAMNCLMHHLPSDLFADKRFTHHAVVPCKVTEKPLPEQKSGNPRKTGNYYVMASSYSGINNSGKMATALSILQCCAACEQEECVGITWLSKSANKGDCYIHSLNVTHPMFKREVC